ncbi:MAG: CapA family protein [Alphaproteobacteria bacterium]|nr:CapA family protein [Alphaproteobacteria bacterium]MBU0802968.1 CapA family protein [Alphaproteobacteria bacterium]MBU0870921.1 CapA family protein [Alphaproteobacteria bacterium]MBU1403408.1 CapA family protein [Alphaproteobacteria bacterium]MBU1589744.1 CapA family protein [Alphaproteobacteria bacterium]
MSNFPPSYKLSWLPRLLKPSLAGSPGLAPGWRETAAPRPPACVRLVFLGDMSSVANRAPPEFHPALRETIASADLVAANCESPVVESAGFPRSTGFGLRHAMQPDFLDGTLAAAGMLSDRLVLSLANNHALDQGVAGLAETLAVLAARGIRTIGTPADGPIARVSAGPLTIGFLAFTTWRNAGGIDFAGRVSMLADIAGWQQAASGLDLVCAVPHWGWEFRHFPRNETRALARQLVESGVGLVAGHHAHVVQATETIGDVPVAYGLGDFLGTALSRQPWPGRVGAMFVADVSAEAGTAGRILASYMVPFLRLRQRHNERLVPVGSIDGAMAGRVRGRLAAIFGDAAGGQALPETL